MKSRSFSFSFDIAGRYAKRRKNKMLRYGKQGVLGASDGKKQETRKRTTNIKKNRKER